MEARRHLPGPPPGPDPLDHRTFGSVPTGYRIERDLSELGVATAADLRALPRQQLVQRFGERVGGFLFLACRGKAREAPAAAAAAAAAVLCCPL